MGEVFCVPSPDGLLRELDRQLSLNETILRTKIIRPEEQKISAAAAE